MRIHTASTVVSKASRRQRSSSSTRLSRVSLIHSPLEQPSSAFPRDWAPGSYISDLTGDRTARVDVYPIDCEFWFPIRRGDNFTRTPRVDRGRFVILHFRPAKDDAEVYCPWRYELRVHAKTRSEREFTRDTFGLQLFDNPGRLACN